VNDGVPLGPEAVGSLLSGSHICPRRPLPTHSQENDPEIIQEENLYSIVQACRIKKIIKTFAAVYFN
jgi:hypothetical protein